MALQDFDGFIVEAGVQDASGTKYPAGKLPAPRIGIYTTRFRDPQAQYSLGLMYAQGHGGSQDNQ